jgi:hypothetical protein
VHKSVSAAAQNEITYQPLVTVGRLITDYLRHGRHTGAAVNALVIYCFWPDNPVIRGGVICARQCGNVM